jgi:two-component system NtrC family response regulator
VKDRDGDALVLAKSFLNRFCQEQGRTIRGFDRDATAAIEAHAWPGNVREIESRVKRAIIMADGTYITPEDLELDDVSTEPAPLNLKQVREEAELRAIQRALVSADDNISEAAKMLGVTRPTLYSLVEKYNLK